MTQQGARSRTLLIGGITLALIAAVIAVTYFNRVAEEKHGKQVEEARLMIDKGIQEYRQKQYQQSMDTLGSISEDVLQDWHIPYYRGSAMIMLRDYEPAAVELEKALALYPDSPNVLFSLGVVYYKIGNLALSKAYFGKVLEVDPGHDDARGLMDIVANLEREQQEDGSQP